MIATDRLGFAYHPTQPPVLQDFSHEFAAETLTVVSGRSGCGKSTLLYLAGLMLTPTRGRVLVDGVEVSSLSDGARSRLRAQHVGFVFQDAVLDPARSVLDNACEGGIYAGMPLAEQRHRARELLARFGIEGRADHRPGEVSGGQAQRVALCRALLKQPRLILADEPTGNLDPDSAGIVWDALHRAAAEGATVIVATHDPARGSAADHRIVLQ
ncbi:MAG: ABC transporter ATP-binding protein [Actinomycetota bacterium]|jgi:ABC-type lipoprotein export system ATPase subunit|nr:ABC transporter ATP-binding protein [Actinomycetota bacterium]